MSIPALLVSVRNLTEARAAVAGGCDLLDVKEPSRGPLGMADGDVIADVAAFSMTTAGAGQRIPCSVALGELRDWLDDGAAPSLPRGISFAKLGPAGLKTARRWLDAWHHVRRRFAPALEHAENLVAVAYADWSSAEAPAPASVLEHAATAGCKAFLIDTYRKDGRTLLDAMGAPELCRLSRQARRSGVTFALAGSVGIEILPELAAVNPDVVAVRGAACRGQNRSAAVSSASVRRLKAALVEQFATASAAAP